MEPLCAGLREAGIEASLSATALDHLPGLTEDEEIAKEPEHRITFVNHVRVKGVLHRMVPIRSYGRRFTVTALIERSIHGAQDPFRIEPDLDVAVELAREAAFDEARAEAPTCGGLDRRPAALLPAQMEAGAGLRL